MTARESFSGPELVLLPAVETRGAYTKEQEELEEEACPRVGGGSVWLLCVAQLVTGVVCRGEKCGFRRHRDYTVGGGGGSKC
jgi:hypothetical protein